MNKSQLIVLWIGIAIIVLMCLFPPWVIIIRADESIGNDLSLPKDIITIKPYYKFILKPPNLSYSGLNYPFYCYVNISQSYIDRIKDRFPRWFRTSGATQNAFIDTPLLTIECAIVALITGGLLFTFTTKEKYKPQEQKRLNLKRGIHRISLVGAGVGAGFLYFSILAEFIKDWGTQSGRDHLLCIFVPLIFAGLGFPVFYVVLRFWVYYFIKYAYCIIRWLFRWLFSGFYDDVEQVKSRKD